MKTNIHLMIQQTPEMRMYHLYTAHTERYSSIQGEIKENPLKIQIILK